MTVQHQVSVDGHREWYLYLLRVYRTQMLIYLAWALMAVPFAVAGYALGRSL